ncbi:MAG TPA: zinc-dependent peptidase, partial [Pseudomonadales bacterium]|nr:zinc-dependent peptidase [Pseudomonadales bacterium]
MFKRLRYWLESRRIKKMGYTVQQWEDAIADWPVMKRYEGAERDALRKLAFRFIVRKNFVSGSGFEITHDMALKIATM